MATILCIVAPLGRLEMYLKELQQQAGKPLPAALFSAAFQQLYHRLIKLLLNTDSYPFAHETIKPEAVWFPKMATL